MVIVDKTLMPLTKGALDEDKIEQMIRTAYCIGDLIHRAAYMIGDLPYRAVVLISFATHCLAKDKTASKRNITPIHLKLLEEEVSLEWVTKIVASPACKESFVKLVATSTLSPSSFA